MAGIKRDYYRLVNLDKSPFNLSLEDALHLGSSGTLPVYVRVTERVRLSSRIKKSDPLYGEGFFLRLETVDLTRIENDHLAGTHGYLWIRRGMVDKRYSEDVRIPDLIPFTPFVSNMLDKHKVNIATYNGHLDEPGYHAAFYFQKHELLCFTEDLEQLLNNEPTPKAASPEASLHPRRQQTYLTLIEALLLETLNEIPSEPYKAAGILQAMLDKQGLSLNKEPIANTIKEILQARGERQP